jgi:hydrogenase expression/formation protein HypE
MAARQELALDVDVESDAANLSPLVERLRERVGDAVRVLRDPTRGGVASALNEIAGAARVGVELDETVMPVARPVAAACELLGLDPLYVANEGVLIAIVDPEASRDAVAALRSHPVGEQAEVIGTCVAEHTGFVAMKTAIGARRVVDMLPGDQLPRIC